jgi:hypothetical protein
MHELLILKIIDRKMEEILSRLKSDEQLLEKFIF